MMSEGETRNEGAVRFSRVVRLSWAVALGASVTVGLGVYDLLGQFTRLAGNQSAATSYLLMIVVALPVILTYAERAAVVPGSGGAYNLARTSQILWLAFSNGWLLIGGYVILVALLAWGVSLHLDTLVQGFFDLSLELTWLAAAVIAIIAAVNMVGTRLRWKVVTAVVFGAIAILILLSVRGFFPAEDLEQVTTFFGSSTSAFDLVALMASSWWGLHLILSVRDKIQRPTKTILPAMLLAVALGGGLGALASLTVERYPGTTPNLSIPLVGLQVGFGLFSGSLLELLYMLFGLGINLFALNIAMVYLLRLLGVMTGDGFLPERLLTVSTVRGTPIVPLALITALGMALVLTQNIMTLVGLASLTFLWTAALVHLPDLFRARPNLPEKRRPKLPFHPLLPAITVTTGILLPFTLAADVWWVALAWLLAGGLFFLGYARQRSLAVRRRELVISDAGDVEQVAGTEYRVMVGLANPDTAPGLIRAGAKLAGARDGSLLVLRTLTLADQMPVHLKQQAAYKEWELLEATVEEVGVESVAVKTLVRLAPDPTEGILAAVSEEGVDLLLLGWEADQPPDDSEPHSVLNSIVRYAECDVAILRGSLPLSVKRVLVPTAGGPNAPLALELGQDLLAPDDGQLDLVNLVTDGLTAEKKEAAAESLSATLTGVEDLSNITQHIKAADTVQEGIVNEARAADLLLIGASKQGVTERSQFGGLAAGVAYDSATPVIIARGRQTIHRRWLVRTWELLSDPLPKLTDERRVEVAEGMRASAVPTVDFYVLITLAAVIASLGLLQNSAAVIIGAMLVAPLMSPILAMALGMVVGELTTLATAAEATVKGVALAIVVGVVMVIISPIDSPTSEILARTEPNILDLMVALASGAAAGYAICRKEVAAALPGVAIAAALVPPLCVVGYGIGTSQLSLASGALLLFVTNLIAIILAAALVFLALGFLPARAERSELFRGLRITVASLVVILVVLGITTVATVIQLNRQQEVEEIFSREIISRAARVEELEIQRDGEGFLIEATIINFEDSQLTPEELEELQQDLTEAVGGPVVLDAIVLNGSHSVLERLDQIVLLESLFTELVVAQSAQVADLQVAESQDGFDLEAAVIAYEDASIADDSLAEIQKQLSEAVDSPVSFKVTIVRGQRTELEAIDLATPTPLPDG